MAARAAPAAPAGQGTSWANNMKLQSQIPGSFELVLTEDLPNGPYGEMSMLGGKVYVAPGASYDDVAAALDRHDKVLMQSWRGEDSARRPLHRSQCPSAAARWSLRQLQCSCPSRAPWRLPTALAETGDEIAANRATHPSPPSQIVHC